MSDIEPVDEWVITVRVNAYDLTEEAQRQVLDAIKEAVADIAGARAVLGVAEATAAESV